jgi:PTH1 family peptidyl-tRNA hydrolase
MYIIVGLGNPGKGYEGTRHNVGRDFLLKLADDDRSKLVIGAWKFDTYNQATVAPFDFHDHKGLMVLPETFMNLSGQAVQGILRKGVEESVLVVAHDDLDLPIGTIKISSDRGAGGHHGVESIIESVKSQDFIRLRIGVSPTEPSLLPTEKFVLQSFSSAENDQLTLVYEKFLAIIESLMLVGLDQTMTSFNGK